MTKKQKKMLWRIVITAVMLIALHFLPITGIAQLIAYLAAYAVIGYDILRKAGKGIANGQPFDENFLMALATLGAFFLAIWTKSGDYVEGIAVMLFYQIGELFQSYAVGVRRGTRARHRGAASPARLRRCPELDGLDLPRSHVPRCELPVRTRHQHSAELLCGHRRREPRGYPHQGLKLSRSAVGCEVSRVRQDRHAHAGRV